MEFNCQFKIETFFSYGITIEIKKDDLLSYQAPEFANDAGELGT